MPDLFYQTLPATGYSADVHAFGDALEAVMADGTHELGAIVTALNARGVTSGGHDTWTPDSLGAYLAELANA